MSDSTFETVLSRQLRAYAEAGVRPIDRFAIAAETIAAGRPRFARRWAPSRARWPLVLVLLVLTLALAASAAIVVGALLRSEPSLPGLGRLAYSLDGDVFIAQWDGTHPVRVADGSSTDGFRFPRWSPNGRHLMYERWSRRGDATTVFIADTSGRVVASFPGFWSTWSPDSTRIATWGDNDRFDIYTPDGVLATRVSGPVGEPGTADGDQFPGWTADSSSIVVSWRGGPQADRAVWGLPVSGDPPRRITLGYAGPGNRAASPDGRRFAIFSDSRLNILNSSGDQLATFAGVGPQLLQRALPWGGGDFWSPDGTRIAYGDGASLNVIDVDTGVITALMRTGTSAAPLRWSPNGRTILFVQPNVESSPWESSPGAIWRIDVDASRPTLVVAGTTDGDWQWLSPASR